MLDFAAWAYIGGGALAAAYALVRLATGTGSARNGEPSARRELAFGVLLAIVGVSQLSAFASNDLLQGAGLAAALLLIAWLAGTWAKALWGHRHRGVGRRQRRS